MMVRRRNLAAVLVLALIAAACGGGTDRSADPSPGSSGATTATTAPAAPSATTATTAPAAPSAPVAPSAAGFDAAAAATVRATASAALAQFGDLPTAGVAILVAYDDGFSFEQIAAAVASGALGPDGSIPGVEPALALGAAFGRKASVRRVRGDRELDVDELQVALAEERAKMASRTADDEYLRLSRADRVGGA